MKHHAAHIQPFAADAASATPAAAETTPNGVKRCEAGNTIAGSIASLKCHVMELEGGVNTGVFDTYGR